MIDLKFLKIFLISIILISIFSCSAFALNSTTYADVVSSSSTAQNLVNKAVNYKSFNNADFVIFQADQYSFYIVWGDLKYENSSVSADEVEAIRYYRSGSGYDYQYHYEYSVENIFNLSLSHEVVSNIDGLGMVSPVAHEYEYQKDTKNLLIFIVAFTGALVLVLLRGVYRS